MNIEQLQQRICLGEDSTLELKKLVLRDEGKIIEPHPDGLSDELAAVDLLNIVAHDKFQEIIDEANRGDSPIRLQHVILDAPSADDKKVSVQVGSGAMTRLGLTDAPALSPGPLPQAGEGRMCMPPSSPRQRNDRRRMSSWM